MGHRLYKMAELIDAKKRARQEEHEEYLKQREDQIVQMSKKPKRYEQEYNVEDRLLEIGNRYEMKK